MMSPYEIIECYEALNKFYKTLDSPLHRVFFLSLMEDDLRVRNRMLAMWYVALTGRELTRYTRKKRLSKIRRKFREFIHS